ncbi:putative oxidoreductase [Escovopsis weberi]|uniref:D-xylose 1-dehydrogenase (NADP(+), D-xylono-1,5-lactone-forming) n=1 Tax=Escovopsis weberi TaxID=150374 RepID=A0A0M8N2W1_ESCWE|nr:putative oxidoreductase [Escovopsis weberi]
MAAFMSGVYRLWQSVYPPTPEKDSDALNFGILGAANIAPVAFVTPAKSHPKVIVHSIAARDPSRAASFAKKHGIRHVAEDYQAILDDPHIDAVYIPLPNGLHFEWALRALAHGKHVLLEKPSTSNSLEARLLFRSKTLHQAGPADAPAPVLMEAFHNRFHPAWTCFLRELDRPRIAKARAEGYLPWFMLSPGDIRYDHALAGGAMMDFGTYFVAALRDVFGEEPAAVEACDVEACAEPRQLCDHRFAARLAFPGGAIGEMQGSLSASLWECLRMPFPSVTVTHRPVILRGGADATDPAREAEAEAGTVETEKIRTVTFTNMLFPSIYHCVTVRDDFTVRKKGTGEPVRTYTERYTKKAYDFRDLGIAQPGEDYWTSHRYMLEQFVNRVRGDADEPGRAGGAVGDIKVTSEDAVQQMRALDMLYTKCGLGSRPTSEFRLN